MMLKLKHTARRRFIKFISLCCATINCGGSLTAQTNHESQSFEVDTKTSYTFNKDREVVGIYYAGAPDWLASQMDARSHWHELPKLETISIGIEVADVTSEELEYIASLKNVKALYLLGADARGLPGSALISLKKMTWLQELGVADNSFTDQDWEFLSGLEGLQGLEVWGEVSERVFAQMLRCKKLKKLYIQGVTGLISDETGELLSSLDSLQEAHFGKVQEASSILTPIRGNKSLESLQIGAPSLSEVDILAVSALHNLERLELEGVEPPAIEKLAKLVKLKDLSLTLKNDSELCDLTFLRGLPQLETLRIYGAQFCNGSLESIRDHGHLDRLEFPDSVLDQATIDVLASISGLTYLAVGNREDSDWYAAAAQSLPQVRIHGTKKQNN